MYGDLPIFILSCTPSLAPSRLSDLSSSSPRHLVRLNMNTVSWLVGSSGRTHPLSYTTLVSFQSDPPRARLPTIHCAACPSSIMPPHSVAQATERQRDRGRRREATCGMAVDKTQWPMPTRARPPGCRDQNKAREGPTFTPASLLSAACPSAACRPRRRLPACPPRAPLRPAALRI